MRTYGFTLLLAALYLTYTTPLISFVESYKQKKRSELNENNPYRTTPSFVRCDVDLCHEENRAIQERLKKVQPALEKFINHPLSTHNTPRIALCCSGGGYRAMLCALGFLQGLETIGLLDCITYLACLSGSSWLSGAWLSLDIPLKKLHHIFKNQLSSNARNIPCPISTSSLNRCIKERINIWLTKSVFNQYISFVDTWGLLILDNILNAYHPYHLSFKLSDQHSRVASGTVPFPLYATLGIDTSAQHPVWLEWTPYEFGFIDYNIHIPVWSAGRHYNNGISTGLPGIHGHEFEPEVPLHYVLGIAGSAFAVNACEVLDHIQCTTDITVINPVILKIIQSLVQSKHAYERFSYARIWNPTYGMAHTPFNTEKYITVADAAIDNNEPTPLVLHPARHNNIIIMFDASGIDSRAITLKKTEAYAHRHRYPFPPIEYTDIDKKPVSVFFDPSQPSAPMIIYIPLIKNEHFDPQEHIRNGFCSKFNFSYTPEQVDTVIEYAHHIAYANKKTLQDAIEYACSGNRMLNNHSTIKHH